MKANELKQLDEMLENVRNFALEIVKKEALKIMRSNKKYQRFYLAMGTWFFEDVKRNNIDNAPCMKTLHEFFCEYDSILKLTGEGIIIESNGNISINGKN